MARISEGHEGLGRRLGGLEERTREELKGVQERMKETLAEERRACQVSNSLVTGCQCAFAVRACVKCHNMFGTSQRLNSHVVNRLTF